MSAKAMRVHAYSRLVWGAALLLFAWGASAQNATRLAAFPETSPVGTMAVDVLGDGRILAWDGETIWTEESAGVDGFVSFAENVLGDPAYVRTAPNGTLVLLGAASQLYQGRVYQVDTATEEAPSVFFEADNQSWGDFLDEDTLLIARMDPTQLPDTVAYELATVDLTTVAPVPVPVVTGAPGPLGAFVVDREAGEVYAGVDLGTSGGAIRVFQSSTLLSATAGTPLAWTSGTALPGSYPVGGPSALTPNGLLGVGGIGTLQLVNKDTLSRVRTLDPFGAGTGFYWVINHPVRDEVLALHKDDLGGFRLYALAVPANCVLKTVKLTNPVDKASYYANNDAGSFTVRLTAEPNCTDDTAYVDFFLRQPDEIQERFLGRDSAPAFTFDQQLFSSSQAWELTYRAEAGSISDPEFTVSDNSRITLLDAGASGDANSDALPDTPFTLLDRPGDRWVAGVTFENAQYTMVTGAASLFGFDPDTDENDPDYDPSLDEHGFNDIRVVLIDREDANQRVEVTASEFLLRDTEVGMLLVQIAPNLDSLLGPAIAAGIGSLPRGDLNDQGLFVQISFLVKDVDATGYTEISTSRLNANPIHLKITGQPLSTDKEYRLLSHATRVVENGGALQIQLESGTWRTVSNQSVDVNTGTIEAELTSLSLFAPFERVSDGTGANTSWLGNFLTVILSGLAALGLAGGGSTSDGPCFIATAAYGTPLASEIHVLRGFRDEWLLTNAPGTALVDCYYRMSPPLAAFIAVHPVCAALVRTALTPVILAVPLLNGLPWMLNMFVLGAAYSMWRKRIRRRLVHNAHSIDNG